MKTDAERVLRAVDDRARSSLDLLEVFAELESTSTWLLQQERPGEGRFRAVIAKHQTAGRGRSGKSWLSPPSSGLCLSIAYTFANLPRNLPSLTLAIGVAIAKALEDLGAGEIRLKWPNDLVAQDGKLGGILTEIHSNGGGGRTVVIGIGLNVDLPKSMRYSLENSWTRKVADLAECMGAVPDRPELAATIITSLIDAVSRFGREGFGGFGADWHARDWLEGRRVNVQQGGEPVHGIADGIDEDGALLVVTNTGKVRIVSGTVELPDDGAACA